MTLRDQPVSSLMQTQFVSVEPQERLDLANTIMQLGRMRHLPVLEGGRLVGMISSRDILSAELGRALEFEPVERRNFLRSVAVSELMSRDVETIGPDEPLEEAARRMAERKIGSLPVVRENRVVIGLLTETDLLRAAYLDPD